MIVQFEFESDQLAAAGEGGVTAPTNFVTNSDFVNTSGQNIGKSTAFPFLCIKKISMDPVPRRRRVRQTPNDSAGWFNTNIYPIGLTSDALIYIDKKHYELYKKFALRSQLNITEQDLPDPPFFQGKTQFKILQLYGEGYTPSNPKYFYAVGEFTDWAIKKQAEVNVEKQIIASKRLLLQEASNLSQIYINEYNEYRQKAENKQESTKPVIASVIEEQNNKTNLILQGEQFQIFDDVQTKIRFVFDDGQGLIEKEIEKEDFIEINWNIDGKSRVFTELGFSYANKIAQEASVGLATLRARERYLDNISANDLDLSISAPSEQTYSYADQALQAARALFE